VVDWHEQRLLPLSAGLVDDPRCSFVRGDFFALAGDGGLGGPDVVLLDVDHTPRHVLHPGHAAFYTPAGVAGLAAQLRPGGVFALWSDDAPDAALLADLEAGLGPARGHVVAFPNPYTGGESTNSVVVATRR
jgi:spermidine synthase